MKEALEQERLEMKQRARNGMLGRARTSFAGRGASVSFSRTTKILSRENSFVIESKHRKCKVLQSAVKWQTMNSATMDSAKRSTYGSETKRKIQSFDANVANSCVGFAVEKDGEW